MRTAERLKQAGIAMLSSSMQMNLKALSIHFLLMTLINRSH